MEWGEDDFGDVDDEDLMLIASQSDVQQSPAQNCERPVKRRKLTKPLVSQSPGTITSTASSLRPSDVCYQCGKTGHWRGECPTVCYKCGETGHWHKKCPRASNSASDRSDHEGSDSTGPSLPPYRRKSSSVDTASTEQEGGKEKAKKQKRRIYIPEGDEAIIPPDQFVTQLTQPPSSPSEIRGPRWKRLVPPSSHPELQSSGPAQNRRPLNRNNVQSIPRDDHSAPGLPNSFKKDRSRDRPPGFGGESLFISQNSVPGPAQTTRDESLVEDFTVDWDNLPSDAFDSSPSSPSNLEGTEPIPVSSQAALSNKRPPQSNGPPKKLRQTTLFGTQVDEVSTQSKERRNWPLASKEEAPTHHKLNQDALKTWIYPMNVGAFRDYQFNIVARGLFHNLLVALPTGLGKTFIAATVMLNWFRWTKDAQLVFVAPTKPLVSQQVEACFQTVGIPRSQTSMLTGTIPPGTRAEEWQSKRVFFMTPQTFINDLKTGISDPKKIVLLVVDEAHRATGAFAYVEVVKFLQRFNTNFRVLALTATPGSNVEAVQNVINSLNIARTEIRTEESLDIRAFVHSKNIEYELFDYTEEMESIMDLCSRALQPVLTQLNSRNAYWGKDPMMLTAYGLTKARQQWMMSDAGRHADWGVKRPVMAMFSVLASIAHSIELLKYHGMGPFFHNMVAFRSGTPMDKYAKQIVNNEHFKKMMNRLSAWMSDPDFIGHPKLEWVKSVILNHFMDAGEGLGAAVGRPPSETRIMVFVHYRDSAEEVVRVLKKHEPMIRPHIFNGQAASKGTEGMDQKTQLATIEAFKNGKYNTLVATSIGEEGLDIGEIDLILCYDSSSSPIRMLQRMGRTGRKRKGNVFLLLMRGKEEESYTKAKDNYQKMQQIIASGKQFIYHDEKSPRILPREIQPVVDKRVIEIPVENSQLELPEPKKRGRPLKRPAKKFHMPDNVETSFMKASRINKRPVETLSDLDNESDKNSQPRRVFREPSPKAVQIPPLGDVLLTSTQEKELFRRYADLHDAPSQIIEPPTLDRFPELLRTEGLTQQVKHGHFTNSWIGTFRTIHNMPLDYAESLRENLRMEDVSNDPIEDSDNSLNLTPTANHASRRRTISKPRKKTPEASHTPIQLSSPSDGGGRGSSKTLSQSSTVRPVQQPFYVSQRSQDWNEGLDEELLDLNELFNKSGNEGREKDKAAKHVRPRPRAKRLVVDDDDSDGQ